MTQSRDDRICEEMERLPPDIANLVAGFLAPRAEVRGETVMKDAGRRAELFEKFFGRRACSGFELDLAMAALKREAYVGCYRTDAETQAARTLASLRGASRRCAAVWARAAEPFWTATSRKMIDVPMEGQEALVLWRLCRPCDEAPTQVATALLAALKENRLLDYDLVGRLGLQRARQVLACRRPGPEEWAAASARALVKFCKAHPRYRLRVSEKTPWPTVGRQLLQLRACPVPRVAADADRALRELGFPI